MGIGFVGYSATRPSGMSRSAATWLHSSSPSCVDRPLASAASFRQAACQPWSASLSTYGSVGRPYPGVEIACREGVIWVRSPYLALDAARDGAARPGAALWQDGWVAPGECGRIEDGYLWLTGRIGRRVKVADQTVQLEVIEEVLAAQPGVQAGAVIAVPDARRGHVLTACVVGDASQEPAILAALRASFGPLMAPRRLNWRASLPLLPSGKTDLAQLMQDHGGRTNG